MKKIVALLLAILLMLSTVTAFAEVYKDKPTVKAVQQALNDAGYNCGKPDGAAGRKTKAAIESYQTDKGLEVTGQIDDALLEALGLAEVEETTVEATEDSAESEEAAQASEAAQDAMPDEDSQDEGMMPKEIVELTGGLPDRLEDLSDKIHYEDIAARMQLWDGEKAISCLRENGTFILPELGHDWDEGNFGYTRNEDRNTIDLAFTDSDGSKAIALTKEYQPDALDNKYSIQLRSTHNTWGELDSTFEYDQETETYKNTWNVLQEMLLSDVSTENYKDIQTILGYLQHDETIAYSVSATNKTEGSVAWKGVYSLETGERLSRFYWTPEKGQVDY